MAGFLFHDIIFGPVKSRRLGISLGINPLPVDRKLCTFNCIYCECGWTDGYQAGQSKLPQRQTIRDFLERKLAELKESDIVPDSLTFAGNGEPTIHPDFNGIIDDTIALRDKYFPKAAVTVLSNATTLDKEAVRKSLAKVDQNILKLDAGTEKTFQKINKPLTEISLKQIVENLKNFKGNLIIQTLFLRGQVSNFYVDNTLETELKPWLIYISEIKPQYVMIYPVDRATPAETLEKISRDELEEIAERVNELGIPTRVYD